MNSLDEYNIYKYIEAVIFTLYMIFIFLSIQIWFLWKDIDKNEIKIKSFFNDAFFKKNCIYISSFSIIFVIHNFSIGTAIPEAYLKFLDALALISLVFFTYGWYRTLETCAHKKALPQELINFRYFFKKN